MLLRRLSCRRLALLAVFLAAFLAPPAAAQPRDEDKGPWYDVPALPSKKPWLQWVLVFVFGVGCVGMGIKNPHRTHLD